MPTHAHRLDGGCAWVLNPKKMCYESERDDMVKVRSKHTTKNYQVWKDGQFFYLKSCNSWVARYDYKSPLVGLLNLELGKDWQYSSTTKRHIGWFLDEICLLPYPTAAVRDAIMCGLVNVGDVSPYEENEYVITKQQAGTW